MQTDHKQKLEENLTFAKALALKAGRIITELSHNDYISTKIDGTTFTRADKETDEFIYEQIHYNYPTDNILSEESTRDFKSHVNNLWIVDPLDGSTNYSQGLPIWGVSISKLINGIPSISVLNFPILDILCYASIGQGAFVNDRPISTKQFLTINRSSIFTCTSGTERHYNIKNSLGAKRRTFGSTIYELYLVANGNAIFSILPKPKIWDIAGAYLIIKEAGGKIDAIKDQPLFPTRNNIDYMNTAIPTLATSSPQIWDEISPLLQKDK